jgi:hypothetical protein
VRWRAILICLTAAVMLERSAVIPDKEESFKLRVGWDAVPGADATDGVVADWSALAEFLKPTLQGLRIDSSAVYTGGPGLMELRYNLRRGPKQASIRVYVSSLGTAHARQRLLSFLTETNRRDVPGVRGPEDLGEISNLYATTHHQSLAWAFRNVCVYIRQDETDTDVVPIAYAIRDFMARSVKADAAASAPRAAIDISPSPVHVGATVRVGVQPTAEAKVDIDVKPRALLGQQASDALSVTYLAQAPGHGEIEVSLLDRKTLLATSLRLPLEILP